MPTAAQLLVRCLLEQDVEYGFGVPGESYLAVLDALHDAGNAFTFINARHEGGAAFMAEGYAKLTGKPGVVFVTRGPGATNASIGVHTAMQDSVPMVVFVGQIETTMREREAFQELDYRAVFGPMCKWATEVEHPDRMAEIVARAFTVAQSGRPGPVVVALPEDVLVGQTDARSRGRIVPVQATPGADDARRVMQRIAQAERPVVLAGGGGWTRAGARDLQRWAEANALPVIVAFRNQDLIDGHSPSYVGDASFGMDPAIRAFMEGSDLIVALNVRFGETLTDAYSLFDPAHFDTPLIHVHAAEGELGKIFTPDVAILCEPNQMVAELASADAMGDDAPWAGRTREAHTAWEAGLGAEGHGTTLDLHAVMRHLREALPDDTVVTNGAGNFAIWAGRLLVYGGERRLIGPQAGSMGAGVPAAVAAKIADPTRTVVCFAGDGDFQMSGMELGTGLQYDARPIVLLFNNGSYGTIRMHQERDYPERVSGTTLVNPDFVALGNAFGMHAERVERTEDFAAAWERAVASPTGALIELMQDPDVLSPKATISGMRARA